ncbi:MAG: PQQ-dependent sugar dehydrogenase [Verrucomicrobiota bacterium]
MKRKFHSNSILKKGIAALMLGGLAFGSYVAVSSLTATPLALVPDQPEREATPLESDFVAFEGQFSLFALASDPVDLGYTSDDALFILSSHGYITRATKDADGLRQMNQFAKLDIENADWSKGASALAFHPNYDKPMTRGYGKFYLSVAEKAGSGDVDFGTTLRENHQEVVYEFQAEDPSADTFTGTFREVLRISQPNEGINIADLSFDSRGLLYIAIGDAEGILSDAADNLTSVYGKVLRIDPIPTADGDYSIPSRNPFVNNTSALDEIWAYGINRPSSVTVDRLRDWVTISDSQPDSIQEINLSKTGAENFSWDSAIYGAESEVEPTPAHVEYVADQDAGLSVGSVFYRGAAFPELQGKLIFADKGGNLFMVDPATSAEVEPVKALNLRDALPAEVLAIKNGPSGELFALCANHKIYELGNESFRANNAPLETTVMAGHDDHDTWLNPIR